MIPKIHLVYPDGAEVSFLIRVTSHFERRLTERFPNTVTRTDTGTLVLGMPLMDWLTDALQTARMVPHRYGERVKNKYPNSTYVYSEIYDVLLVFSRDRNGLALTTIYEASSSHWLWRVSFWHSDPGRWPPARIYFEQVEAEQSAIEQKLPRYHKGVGRGEAEEARNWKVWLDQKDKKPGGDT